MIGTSVAVWLLAGLVAIPASSIPNMQADCDGGANVNRTKKELPRSWPKGYCPSRQEGN